MLNLEQPSALKKTRYKFTHLFEIKKWITFLNILLIKLHLLSAKWIGSYQKK